MRDVIAAVEKLRERSRASGRRRSAFGALLLAFGLFGCDRESRDFVPPVVTLNGEAVMTLSYRDTFSDPGARAMDARDGAVAVTVSGEVKPKAGEYTLTYTATDAAGNVGRAVRTVRVVDDVPPVVTLSGDAMMTLSYRDAFSDPGATATDEHDGELEVTVSGEVESNLPNNSVSNASGLGTLTSLRRLDLRNNPISDISALGTLTALTYLDLGRHGRSCWRICRSSISNISALGTLTALTYLYLDNHSISDISALRTLTSLATIVLDYNSITDAEPMVNNNGLGSGDYIYIQINPLDEDSVDTHIPALRARGADVFCSLKDGTNC